MQNVLAIEQQQFVNKLDKYHDSEGNIEHLVTIIICSKMENRGAKPETQVFMVDEIAVADTFPNRIECRGTTGFSITTKWLINSTLSVLLKKKRKQSKHKLRYALVLDPRLPLEDWTDTNLQYPTDGKGMSSSIDSHSISMKSSQSCACTLHIYKETEQFFCLNTYKVYIMPAF